MITNPHMLPKIRSKKLRKAVANMPCELRIASFLGMPCSERGTVCGNHSPVMGKGTSTKVSDLFLIAGCHFCHDLLDDRHQLGRIIRERYPLAYGLQLLQAMAATQSRFVEAGLILVPDMTVLR